MRLASWPGYGPGEPAWGQEEGEGNGEDQENTEEELKANDMRVFSSDRKEVGESTTVEVQQHGGDGSFR